MPQVLLSPCGHFSLLTHTLCDTTYSQQQLGQAVVTHGRQKCL